MLKLKNRNYEAYQLMHVNLAAASMHRRGKLSSFELLILLLPLLMTVITIISLLSPDLVFFADCKNVAHGDICRITLHDPFS